MKVIKEKHSLAMRWTHWVNFPCADDHDLERNADLLGK